MLINGFKLTLSSFLTIKRMLIIAPTSWLAFAKVSVGLNEAIKQI